VLEVSGVVVDQLHIDGHRIFGGQSAESYKLETGE